MTIHSTFGKLAFSLALAGTFLFPGLDARAANDTTDTLNFVNYRDVRDLNPHLYAGEMYAQEMIFETLVDITADGYKPCLAESWDISADGKVYTFHIRKGVTFTDGTPCDAFAIKANFDAILENRARHTWLEMMHLLEKVDAPDAHTFRIFMKAPYWPMLTELGVTRPFAIISPKAMKNGSTKDGVTAYVGTGPYKLTKVVTDEYAVFEANETYWGEQPKIKRVVVKVIPDNQTRILALEKGEIDLIWGKNMLDADALNKYRDSKDFGVALSAPTSTRHIVLNGQNPVLADIHVRKALQHATNRVAIAKGVFHNTELPADTLYARSVPYCDIDLKPYEYDMAKAARILDEAGWKKNKDGLLERDGKPFLFTILVNQGNDSRIKAAIIIQSQLKALGITVHIRTVEWAAFIKEFVNKGHFDAIILAWTITLDPDIYDVWHSSRAKPGGLNFTGYRNAEVDELLVEARSMTDQDRRKELYDRVQEILDAEQPYCFLYVPYALPIVQARFQGIKPALNGIMYNFDRWWVPKDLQRYHVRP